MKKTLLVFLVFLSTLSVFFCFPVYGATPAPLNRHTDQKSSNSVSGNIVAYQGYPYSFGTSLIGGYGQSTYVYVSFYNNTSTNKRVSGISFQLDYSGTPVFLRESSISSDLYLGTMTAGGSWNILPSADFDSNGLIVPAHTTLYMFAEIVTRCEFNTSSQTVTGASLNSITLSQFTATDTTVAVPGQAQDLSRIVTLLDSIDQDTDDLVTLVQDIKTALSYGGSIANIQKRNYNWYTWNVHTQGTQVSDFESYIKVFELSSFVLSEEMAYSLTNGLYRHDCYVVPVQLRVLTYNYSDTALKTSRRLDINNLLPKASKASLFIYGEEMSIFDKPYFDTSASTSYINLCMPVKLSIGSNGIIPSGVFYDTYTILMIFDDVVSDTFNNSPSFSFNTYSSDLHIDSDIIFTVSDIDNKVGQLLDSFYGSNNGNVSQDSDTLANQSDSVHSQEAQYYAQNTQAIQATGLSNYQFDNFAVSGLQSVRGDFIDVWNSLGGWNSVYIFSLTLGLALTILRHSPSTISSAIRRRKQNND